MLNFKKLELGHMDIIKPYFRFAKNRICDNTAGVAVMWRDFFRTEFAVSDGALIFRMDHPDVNAGIIRDAEAGNADGNAGVTTIETKSRRVYSVPLGDRERCLDSLDRFCRSEGENPVFFAATEDDLEFLRTRYTISTVCENEWSDYLYNADDLRTLAGRRYHGQRNHINAFKSQNQGYTFEVIRTGDTGGISGGNTDELIEFFSRAFSPGDKPSSLYAREYAYVLEVLENYDRYGLCGGMIRAGGKPAAFSVGEIAGDTLHVHIEKADTSHRGIYAVMVNEFVKHFATGDVQFVNREEDLGDEGLRRSKLSYHPCEIIKKYRVNVL